MITSYEEALKIAKNYINPNQLSVIKQLAKGEEGEFFVAKIIEIANVVQAMPITYQTQNIKDPIAQLHYFTNNCDWYITERDKEPEQLQAFGAANFGNGYELGYISIVELLANNAELDLYYTPVPISKIRKRESN